MLGYAVPWAIASIASGWWVVPLVLLEVRWYAAVIGLLAVVTGALSFYGRRCDEAE